MKELLYWIVEWIAKIHSHILRLNDAYEYNFTDKELHFLVIGMMGMGFIFVVYPVFKWLAKHDHVMVIAWIYVLTLIIVITFAIEIGQKVTCRHCDGCIRIHCNVPCVLGCAGYL
mgnify:CR=1 FL=1